MKWFKLTILSLLSLFILAALLIETPPGKLLIQNGLVKALHRSGLPIEVGEIGGNFPQEIEAKNVRLPGVLSVETLRFKLSLLALLGGSMEIEELQADNVVIFDEAKLEEDLAVARREVADFPRIPLSIDIAHYLLTNVQWKEELPVTIEGSAELKRLNQSIKLDGTITRDDASLTYAIKRNRFGKMDGVFVVKAPTTQPEGKVEARAHLRGTVNSFTGTVNGKFTNDRAWAFRSRIEKKQGPIIALQKLIVSTPGLRASGSAELDTTKSLREARLLIQTRFNGDRFLNVQLPTQMEGTVLTHLNLVQKTLGLEVHATCHSGQLKIDGVRLEEPSGVVKGLLEKDGSFQGMLDAKANYLGTPWTFNTELIYRKEKSLTLDHFALHSALLNAEGTVTLVPGPIWIGKVSFQHANGELLQEFVPSLSGLADGTIVLSACQGEQQIAADITARRLSYGSLSVGSAHVTYDKELHAELERVQWKRGVIDSVFIETAGPRFVLQADGKWLQLTASGEWSSGRITIQEADGMWLMRPIHLAMPSTITWDQTHFAWDKLPLQIGPGTLDFHFVQDKTNRDASLELRKLPIDVLSLHPMQNAAVQGKITGSMALHQVGDKTDADWNLSLEEGILEEWGPIAEWQEKQPVKAMAKMEGSLHRNHLKLKTDIQVRDRPFFDFDLNMPLSFNRQGEFSFPSGYATGSLKAEGRLGDLFDFLNLGMHRVDGDMLCDLNFSNGRVRGLCTLNDGYYQNYVTGTELTQMQATLEGAENRLLLTHFSAKDLNGRDVLHASGEIRFSLKDLFPFHFDTQFDHLNIVQIDLVTATAQGHASIEGNLKSALATGELLITESDIAIPGHIPRSYPDLQVVYTHKPIAPTAPSPTKLPYPLELNMKIEAPKAIFIQGRGLNSEWTGDFAIGGTYAEPAVTGSLTLLQGDFSFAGKRFKLEQGSLTLQGNDYKLPLVDLTATTTEKAIAISARIKGPINRPQLTFQSVPPLPLSAILSHLLFGKDLSDVTGLQALQLAGTVASVAGEGPDILEITRKSLGVDRLQIVMTPTKSGDGYENKETIALQVGKVLTPGVVLTIRQSAYDSNPDIGVEVDLLHGFVLEVESQQQTEQGKFSLKWNVNY